MNESDREYTRKTVYPAEAGTDPGRLLDMLRKLDESDCAVVRAFFTEGGRTVLDYCPYPYRRELPFSVFSVSKSLTSAAVGLAVGDDCLAEADRVISFYPEYSPLNMNAWKEEMAVRDLLAMSCGHRYADQGYSGGDPEFDRFARSDPGKNLVEKFLDRPVLHKPGTHFVYNTDGILVLCDIVLRAAGQPLYDYLTERLFKRIGITNAYCDGNNGGHGFFMPAQELAMIGRLYLDGGAWRGEQILPKEWARKSVVKQAQDKDYGYCFWLLPEGAGYNASGLFGQYLFVLPAQDITGVIYSLHERPDCGAIIRIVMECMNGETGKLKTDRKELAAYCAAGEKTPEPKPFRVPSRAAGISNRRYTMKTGFRFDFVSLPDLLSDVSFEFSKETCFLNTCGFRFAIGLDGRFRDSGFTFMGIPRSLALRGEWPDNDRFVLEMRDLTSTLQLMLTFDFAGMNLTMEDKIGWGWMMGTEAVSKTVMTVNAGTGA